MVILLWIHQQKQNKIVSNILISRVFLKKNLYFGFTNFVSLGPPYGYQELIIMTLLKSENKMGTLQEIYEKIMEDFTYFRYATSDRNWKKKIREELNTHQSLFIKVTDDENVQLWMLDPNVDETFILKNLQPTNLSTDELHKCDICDHLFTSIGEAKYHTCP